MIPGTVIRPLKPVVDERGYPMEMEMEMDDPKIPFNWDIVMKQAGRRRPGIPRFPSSG